MLATFQDSNPDSKLSDFTATINWGDSTVTTAGTVQLLPGSGIGVTGTHTYAAPGSDTITVTLNDAGGSSDTVTGSAQVLDPFNLAGVGQDILATQAASWTGSVATFQVSGASATAGDFSAQIDWGDSTSSPATISANASGGFSVNGTHTYAGLGGQSLSIILTDEFGQAITIGASALVVPAPLTASTALITASAGVPYTSALTTFTDSDGDTAAGDFSATVYWEDGTTSAATITANGQGGFTVTSGHAFTQPGSTTITIAITEQGGSQALVTVPVFVDGEAVTGSSPTLTEGAAAPSLTLATFTDNFGDSNPADFAAAIAWGNGDTSTGAIVWDPTNQVFDVSSNYAYPEEGAYQATITITSASNGAIGQGTDTVTVNDAPLTAAGTSLLAIPGTAVTGAIATFTDADPNGAVADYAATIDWGDGTSSPATITANASGGFSVNGMHTYSAPNSYVTTVTINDNGGSSTTAIGSIGVTSLSGSGTGPTLTEGISGPPVVVAAFSSTDSDVNPADFSATIQWAPGDTSPGTVSYDSTSGTLEVSGSNAYPEEGTYSDQITITDNRDGASVVVDDTVTVNDAPLSASGTSISATALTAFTSTVAIFTDADPNGCGGRLLRHHRLG